MRARRWLRQIRHLVRKELLQVFRDPGMLPIIFVVPLVQLFILGYAITTDLKHVRVSVLDQDRTAESRDLVRAFYASDLFVPAEAAHSTAELERRIVRGEADLTLWIPNGFARSLSGLQEAQLAIGVDGQNSRAHGFNV